MAELGFYAAKIMAYGDAFYLIQVNDHNRHVGEIVKALNASSAGIAAALCHDLGKIGNLEKAIAIRKPRTPQDYIDAYADWIIKRANMDKNLKGPDRKQFVLAMLCKGAWKERYVAVQDVLSRLNLDNNLQEIIGLSVSPFPRHADGIPERVLGHSVRDEHFPQAGCPPELADYAFELIRIHHSFRVDRIVDAASTLEARLPGVSGAQFVRDLHTLISADNLVSSLYEKALSATSATFSFGDPDKERFLLHDLLGTAQVDWLYSSDGVRRCRMHLEWQSLNGSEATVVFDVAYYVVEAR